MSSDQFMQTDEQICLQAGAQLETQYRAAVPPIYQSAPFTYHRFEDLVSAERNLDERYVYWRGTNPTVQMAETKLAELEGGEACKCFASGMAAITAAVMHSVKAGDHVVAVGHVYETTLQLLTYLKKFEIDHAVAVTPTLDAIQAAVKPNTKVIYLESPSSMSFELTPIPEVTAWARSKGLRTIMDNTWATPLFQKPLEMGVDIVVHAASKYLGGHNDLVGGAVIASQDIMSGLFKQEYLLLGAAMPPFEAWLLLRGLRTLPLRMRTHEHNGLEVAAFLEGHPKVARVHHPGLPSHPNYALGKQLLKGYSGVFSFELAVPGTYEEVCHFINSLKHFQIGVSWGSFESQVVSPNYGENEEELLKKEKLPLRLIRLAIGLEPPQLLIEDLKQALLALEA
jgi:cystathionine beta-lyase